MTPSPDDHRLAAELAEEAGAALLSCRSAGGGDVGARGDQVSHELLVRRLAAARPDDAVLSEEGADSTARLTEDRVWIVDPLDGTREFSEDRDDWAVHVALVVRGVPVCGAVALPRRGLVLGTHRPPALPPLGRQRRILVSRSRPPAFAAAAASAVGGHLVELGSAGAKAMAVVLGEAEAYVHAGGQYEWDSAAPVAVARAAGLHATRADGSPLVYNQPHPWMPDLVICRRELATAILEVTSVQAAEGTAG